MSIEKKYLKTKPVCKTTFVVGEEVHHGANEVEILGDFTSWKPVSMKKQKSGAFKFSIDLEKDSEYQFRYLIDKEAYENDWNADKYVPSGISPEDNSVVKV